jgi:hypothetical protein
MDLCFALISTIISIATQKLRLEKENLYFVSHKIQFCRAEGQRLRVNHLWFAFVFATRNLFVLKSLPGAMDGSSFFLILCCCEKKNKESRMKKVHDFKMNLNYPRTGLFHNCC